MNFLKRLAPIIALTVLAVIALAAVATGVIFPKTKQVTPQPSKAGVTLSTTCDGQVNHTYVGDLLYHTFNSQGECEAVAGDGERIRQLVGAMAACGKTATCIKAGSCTSGENPRQTSCAITADIPSCSVAQLDCETSNGWGGVVGANCGGCSAPPPPPPSTTASCQLVSADKDLTKIRIGDTVVFSGWGVVSSDAEKVDKINFIISKDGASVSNTTVETTRDAIKDSGTNKAWKGTQTFEVVDPGTYSVRIRVHWQGADKWFE